MRRSVLCRSVCVCRGRRVRYSPTVEFLMFCYEVFCCFCAVLHSVAATCAYTFLCLCVIFCGIYVPDFGSWRAGEKQPQGQMRETCLLSLPQRQGPDLVCSSPVQGRVFGAGAQEGQGGCFVVVLKNRSLPLGAEVNVPSF